MTSIEAAPPARRVCIVTDECSGPWKNGGIGTSMTGLAATLAAAGHAVTLLYTRGFLLTGREVRHWQAVYAGHHIAFESLRPRDIARSTGPLADLDIVVPSAVLDFLSERTFDVVHFNDTNGDGFLAIAAHRAGKLLEKARFAVAIHSPRQWVNQLNRQIFNTPANVALDAAERLSVALADLAWSPSEYIADWMRQHGYRFPGDVRTLQYVIPPMGFPGQQIAPARPASLERQQVRSIVFFGRLEQRKGLGLFLNAIDSIAGELAAGNIEVVFLGRVVEFAGLPSDAAITARTAAWRMPWRIVSDLGQRDALAFLAEPGRLAVMASPADNSPCTVYEALEFNLCFLAAATGGIPELVHPDDRGGVLFDHDGHALADRLRAVLADGAVSARPAQTKAEREQRWLAFHVEAGGLAQSDKTVEPRPALIVIDAAGREDQFDATLASLPASGPRPLVMSRISSLTDPRCDVVEPDALRAALAARLSAAPGAPVLFVHAGLILAPEAVPNLVRTLLRGRSDGLAPSVLSGDGRRADALAASLPASFMQGPAATGLIMLSADSVGSALAVRAAPDAGPFGGIVDAALVEGAFVAPDPSPAGKVAGTFLKQIAPEMTQGRLELYATAGPETAAWLALLASLADGRSLRRTLKRKLGFMVLRSLLGPALPELLGVARAAGAMLGRLKARMR